MKKGIIALLTICILNSCKKEEKISWNMDEIVQTDDNGNIISVGNTDDWQDQDVYSNTFLQELEFRSCREHYDYITNYDSIDVEAPDCFFSENCSPNEDFSVVVFPNPVPSGESPNIRVTSSKGIIQFSYSYKRKSDDSTLGFGGNHFPGPTLYHEQSLLGINQFRNGEDLELFVNIHTTDSCMNFTSGKIIFLD